MASLPSAVSSALLGSCHSKLHSVPRSVSLMKMLMSPRPKADPWGSAGYIPTLRHRAFEHSPGAAALLQFLSMEQPTFHMHLSPVQRRGCSGDHIKGSELQQLLLCISENIHKIQKVTSYSSLTEWNQGLSNTGLLSSYSRAFLQPGLQGRHEQCMDQRMLMNGQSPSSQIAIFTSLIRMCPYCKQQWFPPPTRWLAPWDS